MQKGEGEGGSIFPGACSTDAQYIVAIYIHIHIHIQIHSHIHIYISVTTCKRDVTQRRSDKYQEENVAPILGDGYGREVKFCTIGLPYTPCHKLTVKVLTST